MISVRALKFRLENGEEETLITDIREEKYGMQTFKALYYKRWGVETKYNEIKNKLEVENFSGRLAGNIHQDFFTAMVLTNLAADFFSEARTAVDKRQEGKHAKYEYQVNVNHEIGVLKDRLIKTMLEDDEKKRGQMFEEIVNPLEKRLIPIRSNRSLPRTIPRKAKFHHNHKSNC